MRDRLVVEELVWGSRGDLGPSEVGFQISLKLQSRGAVNPDSWISIRNTPKAGTEESMHPDCSAHL